MWFAASWVSSSVGWVFLTSSQAWTAKALRSGARDPALWSEDQLKRFLESHLVERGWTVTVARGRDRGVDLLARRKPTR
jgi:hypothetical protein